MKHLRNFPWVFFFFYKKCTSFVVKYREENGGIMMAKEKYQTLEAKDNERVFYYEILGIVLLILSMLSIAKLGLVGKYLMLMTKLLFGDWYFMVTFLTIAYGIRCILVHQKLKVNNVRYLGIFISILSIILLSHFAMHRFVKAYDENYLKLTFRLYFNAFKSENPDAIVGGGIIGGLIFYCFYYLFSEIGVVLLSIVLIFLGIVFICKKTIKDFLKMIIHFFQGIYKRCRRTASSLHQVLDTYDASYQKTKVRYKIENTHHENIYQNELKLAKEHVKKIQNILNQMNYFYAEISYIVCRNVTVFFIASYHNIDFNLFQSKLNTYFDKFLLKFDDVKKELMVELTNAYQVPLTIGELAVGHKDEIIFGMDDRNEQLMLDANENKLLIIGKDTKRIAHYIDSIILGIFHQKKEIDYFLIDLHQNTVLSTSHQMDELNAVLSLLNERIQKLQENGVSSLEQYNQKVKKKEKQELVIIHGVELLALENDLLEKLFYLLEVGAKNGFYFIFTVCGENESLQRLIHLFSYRIFLDDKLSMSKRILGYQRFDYLNAEVEAYLSYRNTILRMSLLSMSEKEKESIKK